MATLLIVTQIIYGWCVIIVMPYSRHLLEEIGVMVDSIEDKDMPQVKAVNLPA
jgi:hypothetical protein